MSQFALHSIYTPPNGATKVDIVFVHGLGGDFSESWTKVVGGEDQCWPLWLSEKFPGAAIWNLEYPSSKLSSMFGGPDLSLLTVASGVADLLRAEKLGSRPLVFVAHSLGGIIVKAVLRNAEGSIETPKHAIFDKCLCAVFFGTPHTGSTISTIFSNIAALPSLQIKESARAGAILIELYDWYRNATNNGCIRTKAFYETIPLNGIIIVDAGSANPGVPLCDPVPINADHVEICKFDDKNHAAYKSVVTFLEELFDERAIDTSDEISIDDLEFYLSSVSGDHKSLEQKLSDGGRLAELKDAEREKERLAKTIQRESLSSSARKEYRVFLGEVLTRFRLHVAPLIRSGESQVIVNSAIEKHVITPLTTTGNKCDLANFADIHSAIYYLTGNCHLDWMSANV